MLNRALKLMRNYHQFSQIEFSKMLSISNSYLCEIERGDKYPSIELLEKYSIIFKMPISSILFFSENLTTVLTPGTKLRVAAADRVLRLLEWFEDHDAIKKN